MQWIRNKLESWPIVKQFIKFAIIGSISAAINFVVLIFLTEIISVWYVISSIIGFVLSAIFNFTLNKIWTFRNRMAGRMIISQAVKYLTVVGSSLVFNTIIIYGLTEYFGIDYRISWFVASIMVAAWNFTLNKTWTFRHTTKDLLKNNENSYNTNELRNQKL